MKLKLLFTLLTCCSLSASSQGIYHVWGQATNGGVGTVGSIFNAGVAANNYTDKFGSIVQNLGVNAGETDVSVYNGKYFGVCELSGIDNGGILFEWDPVSNVYTDKMHVANFNGLYPSGKLQLLGNKFYGVTKSGGIENKGSIFEWDPVNNIAMNKVVFITGSECYYPICIQLHSNGKFYGIATGGGINGFGAIFEWDPVLNIVAKKVDLAISSGTFPTAALTEKNGVLYGTTLNGGLNNKGVLFAYDPISNTYINKYDFSTANGVLGSRNKGMMEYNNKLYGLTQSGGVNNYGVLFEWDIATDTYTKKYEFSFGVNGYYPTARLSVFNNKMYGTTANGGSNTAGVIFEWDPATSIYTKKFDFVPANGRFGGFLNFEGAQFYGICISGGVGNQGSGGTIFNWDPVSNSYTKRLDLNILPVNGSYPTGGLTSYKGKLYGMTPTAGKNNEGVIFEIDPITNTLTKKIDFNDFGCSNPSRGLTLFNGKLYGTTRSGGVNARGTLFEWDPLTNIFIKKYDLGSVNDGSSPQGDLTLYNNKLYGVTQTRGANNKGTIFEWEPITNSFTKKHDFADATGANGPLGGNTTLTVLNNKIYGATPAGGVNFEGVLFEWDPATNIYTKKIDLSNLTTGQNNFGALTALNGKLYGTFADGGTNASGVLFEWEPVGNTFNVKYDFPVSSNGSYPISTLTYNDGKLYGMTIGGGNNNKGVLFEWDLVTNTYSVKKHFTSYTGNRPDFKTSLTLHPAPVADGVANSCVSFPSVTIDNTNNNQWVPLVDNNGNAVAEIKANGNNLGLVTVQAYINSGTVREDGAHKLYLDRNLTITPQTQPASAVDIRLYLKGSEFLALKNAVNSLSQPSGISTIDDVSIFKNGESCVPAILFASNPIVTTAEQWAGSEYVLSGSISSFSSFYFANKLFTVLPLRLLEFTAQLKNNATLLNWTTENEINTEKFIVERSLDAINYTAIGTVTAANSSGNNQYQYTDATMANLAVSVVYYRLKMYDRDGRFSYSKIVRIRLNSNRSELIVYPNPVSNDLYITIPASWQGKKVVYEVINSMGQKVQSNTIISAGQTQTLSLERLSAGSYVIRLINYRETKSAVIQKR